MFLTSSYTNSFTNQQCFLFDYVAIHLYYSLIILLFFLFQFSFLSCLLFLMRIYYQIQLYIFSIFLQVLTIHDQILQILQTERYFSPFDQIFLLDFLQSQFQQIFQDQHIPDQYHILKLIFSNILSQPCLISLLLVCFRLDALNVIL